MEIIRRNDRLKFISQDKAIVKEIVSPRNSVVKNHSLAEVTIRPGRSILEHYHVESEELFYILQGEGSISVEGETCLLGEGDVVAILPGKIHKVKNDGKTDLIMLVVCSPSYCDDDQVLSEYESS